MRLLRRIFFCDIFILPRAHNRLVVAKLQYLRVQKRRYVEFWRGRVSHEPTKIPTTAFSDQIRDNSKKDKTKTSQMMGWIENRPNKFLNQNFVRFGLPAKSETRRFRFISLLVVLICRACSYPWGARRVDAPPTLNEIARARSAGAASNNKLTRGRLEEGCRLHVSLGRSRLPTR